MQKRRPDVEEAANKFSEGLLLPIFAVAAVFLFIVLCFYAYNHVMKGQTVDSNGQIVLPGNDSPFKVAPKDPGGMEVPYTETAVFNTVTGSQENIGNSVNVEQEESPVSREQIAAAAEGDEVISPNDEATTQVVNGNIDETTPESIKKEEALKAAAVKEASASDLVEVSASKPDATNSAPAEQNFKAEVKKETDVKTGESKTVVEFKEQPKQSPASIKPAAGNAKAGSFYVQVSSNANKADAESSWGKFSKKYSSDISGFKKNIVTADVKGKTYYRVTFGPFNTRDAASSKCGLLKTKGQECIVQSF